MKKGIILLSFALLYFGLSGICRAEEIQAKKIKLLFAGEQATVVLNDHPAVRNSRIHDVQNRIYSGKIYF